ncbi:MAG: riboflavin synthase [Bacteroidetes bacterium]|nr:riboflavin synthase [Bacteroidota bacterium]MDE2671309.1 riboflavin synthase [Bacteroidota bacterium]
MFTGLIEQIGQLKSVQQTPRGRVLTIGAALSSELCAGQSIAINGTCQSVIDQSEDDFTVLAVPETISKTTLGALSAGTPVNLERAVFADSRLDGHIVQGHVDTTCPIAQVSEQGGERLYEFVIPSEYAALVIPRGSIALDGISLTIADLSDLRITVAIIPHTFNHTNVSTWKTGMHCNVEFDVLAKFVARQMDVRL